MEERVRTYARLRLGQAREELETARENLERGHLRAAISRAYYGIFYMASAALFSRSITRAKHSGLAVEVSTLTKRHEAGRYCAGSASEPQSVIVAYWLRLRACFESALAGSR